MELIAAGSLGPVTALCVYKGYILAGCGSMVQVYKSGTCDLQTSLVALLCRTVHGFRMGPVINGKRLMCVFGGKCARILGLEEKTLEEGSHVFESLRLEAVTAVEEFEDWIWDAVWLQRGDSWTLGLALAHNIVLHWDWHASVLLQRATCTEKCLLYCAHFIGKNWCDLVLAAGTVFNQVVLWSPGDSNRGDVDQPKSVLHQLTGHKGVIFSIFFHHGLQRICSASDDRSIIMYHVQFSTQSNDTPGDGRVKVRDWKQAVIEPVLTVFGHSGRVWDVVLLTDLFVSIGEDAHCIVWSYAGDILHKHKGHKGRSIWSLAASEDETFVVTGGGDCSIRQWHLLGNNAQPHDQTQMTIPHAMKASADDFVRTLALWDYDTVMLITNAGSVLCYSVSSDRWQSLVHDPDFASYSTAAVSTDKTYLAIASITGHVRVLQRVEGTSDVRETKSSLHSGKICGLTWVDDHHILTTGLQGFCVLATVEHTPEGALTLSVLAQLGLPVCKHRWVVSGCLISPSSQAGSWTSPEESVAMYLACGDRSGSVHCYQLACSATGQAASLPPTQTFAKVHGSAGVTCVCYHDNTVYTTGRDGQYRRWTINNGQLQLLNSSRVFKGFDWIDRLWVEEDGLYILGFYSSKFVVWDQKQGETLLEVECGGGHRAWDCCLQGQGYRFIFIKAKEVVMVTAGQSSSQDIVKPPVHGMKVWEMKHLYSYSDYKGDIGHVMCTASEDTTLSLGTLHSHSCKDSSLLWTGWHILHAHLSSIRAVAVVHLPCSTSDHTDTSSSSQSLFSTRYESLPGDSHTSIQAGKESPSGQRMVSSVVFSAGGRAQIQAWRVMVVKGRIDSVHGVQPTSVCSQAKSPATSGTGSSADAFSAENRSSSCNHISADRDPNISSGKSMTDTTMSSQQTPCRSISERESTKPTYEHLGGCFLGESRHKRHHKPWKTRFLKLDPETRIMSLAAVAAQQLHPGLSSSLHLLAAAGSDGVLRLFLFDESRHHFTLLCQSSHHNGCILKVFIHLHPSMPPPSTSQGPLGCLPLLFSAATDGQIAVWNLQPVVQWLLPDTGHAKTSLSDAGKCGSHPATGDHSYQSHAAADQKEWSKTGSQEQNERYKRSGDGAAARQVKKSQGHPESGDRNNKEGFNYLDHFQGQKVVGNANSENHDESSEAGDYDDESGDDEKVGKTPVKTGSIHSNMMRNQYLGDGPSVSLQQMLEKRCSEKNVACTKRDGTRKDESGQWSPDQEFKAHQSGVNGLHARSFTDGSLLLASGGDDNALTVHKLTFNTGDRSTTSANTEWQQVRRMLDVVSVFNIPDAHAAQITGVWVLSERRIVTASVDQRVNLWCLTQDSQLKLESCRFVDTTDLSNIEVWQYLGQVFIGVCGEGVAVLTIPDYRPQFSSPDNVSIPQ
ncbi:tRNA (34-2'-O)-methyltransferase regulator WDR6-like [Littorina saxatilis]|uniref:tRNA (34-2'-O)-methyltransferase regulator WDR6 n=1 Tax=Littorina saxatilis TaxID=31220 RepID=A0AAN9GK37_9CAEN